MIAMEPLPASFATVNYWGVHGFGFVNAEAAVRAARDRGNRDCDIDDDDAFGHGDLDRGEADARRVVHRLQHVIHERAVRVRDAAFDRRGFLFQARIGRDEDGTQCHGH